MTFGLCQVQEGNEIMVIERRAVNGSNSRYDEVWYGLRERCLLYHILFICFGIVPFTRIRVSIRWEIGMRSSCKYFK